MRIQRSLRTFLLLLAGIGGIGILLGSVPWSAWFDRASATPVLVHEVYVAVSPDSANVDLSNIAHDKIFDRPGSEAIVECKADECTSKNDAGIFSFLKQVFVSGVRGVPIALAQGADTVQVTQGIPSIATTAKTWQFTIPKPLVSGGVYTLAVSSKNVSSNDVTKATTCPNGSTANDCVPAENKVHRFENIQLIESGNVIRSFDPVTVPASPNPQGWTISLGALEAGKTYTVSVLWNNDYVSIPTGIYNTNVEIDSVAFTREVVISGGSTSASSDIIGMRAYSNPEYRGLSDWYQTYAPNPGKPNTTTINGYPALIDGNTTYVMGFNMVNKADLPCWGVGVGKCSVNVP